MKILILLLLLVGCQAQSASVPSEYETECKDIGNSLYRCENKETVCYKYVGYKAGGLSCKWKVTNE